MLIFVEGEGHIDGACGEEFGRPRCCGFEGAVGEGGRECVDCVCGEVGAEVEGGDEGEGTGEEEGVRAGEDGVEGGEDGGAEGGAGGGILDYCAVRVSSGSR